MNVLFLKSHKPDVVGTIDANKFAEMAIDIFEDVPVVREHVTKKGYFDISSKPDDDEVKAEAEGLRDELLSWLPSTIINSDESVDRLMNMAELGRPITASFRVEDIYASLRVDRYHCDTLDTIPWPTVFASSHMPTNTLEGLLPVPHDMSKTTAADYILSVNTYLKDDKFQRDVDAALSDPGCALKKTIGSIAAGQLYVINGIHNRVRAVPTPPEVDAPELRLSFRYLPHERHEYPQQVVTGSI